MAQSMYRRSMYRLNSKIHLGYHVEHWSKGVNHPQSGVVDWLVYCQINSEFSVIQRSQQILRNPPFQISNGVLEIIAASMVDLQTYKGAMVS